MHPRDELQRDPKGTIGNCTKIRAVWDVLVTEHLDRYGVEINLTKHKFPDMWARGHLLRNVMKD